MASKAGIRFGRNLRELREAKQLTQEDLAAEIGIASNSISKLERGISFPSGKTVDAISEYFGVDIGLLFIDGRKFDGNLRAIQKATSDELKKAYVSFCRQYGIEIRIEKDEG